MPGKWELGYLESMITVIRIKTLIFLEIKIYNTFWVYVCIHKSDTRSAGYSYRQRQPTIAGHSLDKPNKSTFSW